MVLQAFQLFFLKLFKEELSKPISLLANISLHTLMFPNILKTAKVTPSFKNDDPALCNSYRQISLLSNISKIFGKVIHARLSVFLSTNILYEKQFGFQNQHSANLALIQITEKIKQGCDSGKFVCGVFLDFQKAFDTVNHDILLKKLEHYGIRDKLNKWLRSFLEGRKQHTSFNKTRCSDKLISIGVLQGSILGPFLLILFINDFHKAVDITIVHHFADNTNLLLTENSLKKLNKHINRDLKSLNTGKTKIVIFKSRNRKISKHHNFPISGQKIVPVDSVKYPGK